MLETLSIIAYKQPVTKAEIEKIRGVKSDHAVNKLVEYNLVKELGRLDAPGRPILFGTTEEFLRTFGVQGIEELPSVDPVKPVSYTHLSLGQKHWPVWDPAAVSSFWSWDFAWEAVPVLASPLRNILGQGIWRK